MNENSFQGYPEPSSNTLYCPNQFFDVVLPHSSRGVVRLVGYMLRRVLGWCDDEGRPQEPTVAVSWNDLVRNAGIARGAIREALDEAVAARFIRCLRPGRPDGPNQPAVPALYELCWDDRGDYITDPAQFQGFYSGNGNLTYIPNAFFDHTLRTEPLSVLRVVGAIIRNTIGWQTHYGFRRQKVAISFTGLQRQTHLSRQVLNDALQQALAHNHLVRLEEGVFDRQAGLQSKPATYGIKWRDQASESSAHQAVEEAEEAEQLTGTDGPVQKPDRGTSSKTRPDRFKNQTGRPVQKPDRERFRIQTGNRFKNQTGLEITDSNNTSSKQQQQEATLRIAVPAVAAQGELETDTGREKAIAQLVEHGFDEETATLLAESYPLERITRQCNWIERRSAQRNRLGLLRRAIEQDWPEPRGGEAATSTAPSTGVSPTPAATPASVFAAFAYAGLAGNSGQPAAVPSLSDLEAATPFVEVLQSLLEATDVADWGRQFGSYVRQLVERADRGVSPRSIATALRTYGDGFQVAFQQRLESDRRRHQAEQRKAHQERFADAYRAYLQQRRDHLQAHQPELWAQFAEYENEQRAKILRVAPEGSRLRQTALDSFDSGSEQLDRLVEFAKSQPGFPVLSFWAWDKELNPERPKPKAA